MLGSTTQASVKNTWAFALQGGRRDQVFLMTKHHGRDKKTAMKHLEDSLRRLKTDYIDLWMFHECVYDQDPERIFAPGGGIEAAELDRILRLAA